MEKIKMTQKTNLTTKEAFDEFILDRKSNDVTEDCIKDYNSKFKVFAKFFDVNQNVNVIDKNVFRNYKLYLTENYKNTSTIHSYLTAVRSFLNYFMQQEYIEYFKITLPKKTETKKIIFTDDELNKLLEKPNVKKCTFAEYRTWVITNYLLATGNRIKTVINILNGDVNFEKREIFLRVTKNKIPYTIPLPKSLISILKEYQKVRGDNPDDFLFCTEHGEQLTIRGIQMAFYRYAKKRNVEKTSEHLMRHTFAKLSNDNHAKLTDIQYLLGHSSIEMTAHYIGTLCDDVKKEVDITNPLEAFQKKKHIKMKA